MTDKREGLAKAIKDAVSIWPTAHDLEKTVDAALAYLADDARDAERYRLLRKQETDVLSLFIPCDYWNYDAELDAAVDAAINTAREGES